MDQLENRIFRVLMKKGYSNSEKCEPFKGCFKTPGRLRPRAGLRGTQTVRSRTRIVSGGSELIGLFLLLSPVITRL